MKVFFITIIAIYIVLFFISKYLEVKQLKKENQALKSASKLHENVSESTIEAVRYAMKHAHPDNGGNAEDFMRFKKCYEELTRKR